jgi:hypothetical protein
MSRAIGKLTARSVAAATKKGRYADGGGLYLVVSKSGSKSWAFRYTRNGKAHEKGLGSADLSLADARRKAQQNRELLEKGLDPLEAEKPTKAPSFRECAEEFLGRRKAGWAESYIEKWERQLAYAYGVEV